jgi:hypothetical protein
VKDLFKEVTFDLRPEDGELSTKLRTGTREENKYKVPESGKNLHCSRNRREPCLV